MVVAKSESWRTHRIKQLLSNLNHDETKQLLSRLNLEKGIGLNNHCRIWILMRGILKTWNTFEAKVIGLNGHCRIWILRKVFWKSWYTFEAKEIGLNGCCQIWIPREVFWKLWYFEIKIDRSKWLLWNLNPKRVILKTLIFWENMTSWYEHAWCVLGIRVRHTYLFICIAICFWLINQIWICFFRLCLCGRDLTWTMGRLLSLFHPKRTHPIVMMTLF